MWPCVAGVRDYAPCQKWAKREDFVAFPGGTRDMFIRDVRRSGRWFHERGCILEHRIFRLRDRCSASYNLASFLHGRRNTLDRWSGKIAKRIGTRPAALHSTSHFWRTSRRIASFLVLSTSKEVSQNCFDFDVVKIENWGNRAELLPFWCCHLRTWRKTDRQLQLQTPLALHYTTTTTTNANILRCIMLHLTTLRYTTLHYTNYI